MEMMVFISSLHVIFNTNKQKKILSTKKNNQD